MVNTKVSLCGIEIDNPVIPASGTFGCILTSSITGLKPGESYRLIFGS